jgi:hypothetical protein
MTDALVILGLGMGAAGVVLMARALWCGVRWWLDTWGRL